MVLPALALGVPSGAMIGGLLDQALPAAFNEPWARTWQAYGFAPGRVARHALRRALAGVLPQLLPTVVGLVGGAVAVEKIFNIPGLGRLALDAATAQDLPPLQTATLALSLLGVVAGLLIRALRRALLGPALRDGALPALHAPALPRGRFPRWAAAACALALLALITAGLIRDPLHVDTAARLLPPSAAHPLGTDALGRDLLARLGHGALRTVGVALVVTAVCTLTGLLLGMAAQVGAGLTEVVSTMPAVLAAVTGPSASGAALAVCMVGWTPYAAQAAALLEQERASGHIFASISFGAGRGICSAVICCPPCCPASCATPSCVCPPRSSSWPPSASSAWVSSRPPRNGAACCRRTSRTWNWRPGPYSARRAHSSCSPYSPCPVRLRDGAAPDGDVGMTGSEQPSGVAGAAGPSGAPGTYSCNAVRTAPCAGSRPAGCWWPRCPQTPTTPTKTRTT